jgi:hypothetical protein
MKRPSPKAKTELRGIVVEDHPYDRGYWARYDGLPSPGDKAGRAGWRDCNRELAAERHPETDR